MLLGEKFIEKSHEQDTAFSSLLDREMFFDKIEEVLSKDKPYNIKMLYMRYGVLGYK